VCGNDCGGGGCLELSKTYVSVWTEDGGGRRTEDGGGGGKCIPIKRFKNLLINDVLEKLVQIYNLLN
jgi:hypothetical protein